MYPQPRPGKWHMVARHPENFLPRHQL